MTRIAAWQRAPFPTLQVTKLSRMTRFGDKRPLVVIDNLQYMTQNFFNMQHQNNVLWCILCQSIVAEVLSLCSAERTLMTCVTQMAKDFNVHIILVRLYLNFCDIS